MPKTNLLNTLAAAGLCFLISGCGKDNSTARELADYFQSDPTTKVTPSQASCMADQTIDALGEDRVSGELRGETITQEQDLEYVGAVMAAYENCVGEFSFEDLANASEDYAGEVADEETPSAPTLACNSPQVVTVAEELGGELILYDLMGGREAVEAMKSAFRMGGMTEAQINAEYAGIVQVESLHSISDYGIDQETGAIRCEGDLSAKWNLGEDENAVNMNHTFKFEYILGTSSTGDSFVRGVSLRR